MRTTEIVEKINIPRQKLHYLEQKGYISPKRIPMGEYEAREYSDEDFSRSGQYGNSCNRDFDIRWHTQKPSRK